MYIISEALSCMSAFHFCEIIHTFRSASVLRASIDALERQRARNDGFVVGRLNLHERGKYTAQSGHLVHVCVAT